MLQNICVNKENRPLPCIESGLFWDYILEIKESTELSNKDISFISSLDILFWIYLLLLYDIEIFFNLKSLRISKFLRASKHALKYFLNIFYANYMFNTRVILGLKLMIK